LTVFVGAIIFSVRGDNPLNALYIYFIEPLTELWSLEELLVKAAPLVLIGTGLVVCFKAGVWNIGAEGQLVIGALAGVCIPILYSNWQSPLIIPLMLMLGMAGGALYGAIPAFLKNRFNANEILTSLMLVYVAQLLADWLVRGPWRDPHGYNFPKSITFEGWQLLPTFGSGRIHIGVLLALFTVFLLSFMLTRTRKGFEIKVTGNAPRAGLFSGFSPKSTVMFTMVVSGALAGLAGICEVAGPIGHLQPIISPNYGFTAIIVAFLGRLNPIGVLFAGLLLALSYLGGEAAQISLGISAKITQVFQGLLLLFILAFDVLIKYRIRLAPSQRPQKATG
jgi:simple sugar transport system permease protein